MKLRSSGSFLGVMAAIVVVGTAGSACSGGRREEIFENEGASSGAPSTSSSGETDGTSSGGIGTSGGASSSGNPDDFAECTSSSAVADLNPVYLTIMLDESGSMCYVGAGPGGTCSDANSRWQQVQTALNAFFQSADSSDVFVSVIPFNGSATTNDCSASKYQTVPSGLPSRLALPTSGVTSFGGPPSGGTPTGPALRGGLTFTQAEAQSGTLPGNAKVAMLFVTDGVPDGCKDNAGNTIDGKDGVSPAERQPSLDAAAASAAAGVPLYVLGIGGAYEFEVLDSIAAAAGTNNGVAFKIEATNPGDVSTSVLAALAAIRGEQLSCELQIPAPPENETLDYTKVNVVHTPAGGADVVLPRSDDCADASGWHYDDPTAPTTIQLCDGACATAKGAGTLKIVLGCATQGPS